MIELLFFETEGFLFENPEFCWDATMFASDTMGGMYSGAFGLKLIK